MPKHEDCNGCFGLINTLLCVDCKSNLDALPQAIAQADKRLKRQMTIGEFLQNDPFVYSHCGHKECYMQTTLNRRVCKSCGRIEE